VVPGSEAELALLLDLFPDGVEELDDGFAVYTDAVGERAVRERFPTAVASSVADGWEDAWRDFHHGVLAGRLWVGPPWEEPSAGAESIVIDPGRAFGTGAHPTTRLSLELLQRLEPGSLLGSAGLVEQASLLDIGCGSGVLAIAAAKLGFAPVTGVDVDEAAVEATLANARANGVHVGAYRADALVDELPQARVAVANVALDVVERLSARLDVEFFVASGYLERDEPQLPGRRRRDRRTSEGWAADLFERA